MAINSMYGFSYTLDSWRPQIEISSHSGHSLPGDYDLDPFLPALGTDPLDPRRAIVIPAGRFCSVGLAQPYGGQYERTLTSSGRATLTTHNGRDTKPIGMSVNALFRRNLDMMLDSFNQTIKKGIIVELPHIASVNNAYGELRTSDKVTGYYGSTVATTPNMVHRGKPAKWLAQTVNTVTASASAAISLTSAGYAGINPVITAAFNAAGALLPSVASTLSFNGTNWVANFTGTGSATVATVQFTYGHSADQIAGEMMQLKSLVQYQNDAPLLKFVENGSWMDIPPVAQRRAVNNVVQVTPGDPSTGETPGVYNAATNQYRVANYPVSVFDPVTVWIAGTITDINGNSSTYAGNSASTWYQLTSGQYRDMRSTFYGDYYSFDWITGILTLMTNVVPTAVRITYSYLSDPREAAVLWGQGIYGLTDGRYLNTAGQSVGGVQVVPNRTQGIPAHLNYQDVLGGGQYFIH